MNSLIWDNKFNVMLTNFGIVESVRPRLSTPATVLPVYCTIAVGDSAYKEAAHHNNTSITLQEHSTATVILRLEFLLQTFLAAHINFRRKSKRFA
jgi:hypothetical protein